MADPADFLIERRKEKQPAWHNARTVYRLKRWMNDINRYNFEGDEFWLNNVYSKLRNEFGIDKPEDTIMIVDLTEF